MGFPLDGDPDDADSRLSLLKETASSKSVVSPKHCARFASYVGLGAIAAVALVGWGLLSSYDSPRNSLIYCKKPQPSIVFDTSGQEANDYDSTGAWSYCS